MFTVDVKQQCNMQHNSVSVMKTEHYQVFVGFLAQSCCDQNGIHLFCNQMDTTLHMTRGSWMRLELTKVKHTVKILCIGTDRSQQTVQTKIRLLLKKQSDQGLRCLPLHLLLLDALMQCNIKLYQF